MLIKCPSNEFIFYIIMRSLLPFAASSGLTSIVKILY